MFYLFLYLYFSFSNFFQSNRCYCRSNKPHSINNKQHYKCTDKLVCKGNTGEFCGGCSGHSERITVSKIGKYTQTHNVLQQHFDQVKGMTKLYNKYNKCNIYEVKNSKTIAGLFLLLASVCCACNNSVS